MRLTFKRLVTAFGTIVLVLFLTIEVQLYVFTDSIKDGLEKGFNPRVAGDDVALHHPNHDHGSIRIGPRFKVVHDAGKSKKHLGGGIKKAEDIPRTTPAKLTVAKEETKKKPSTDTPRDKAPRLFYDPKFDDDDRIVTQMHYKPKKGPDPSKPKVILAWNGVQGWEREGNNMFVRDKCPVQTCTVTSDHSVASTADAILFQHHMSKPNHKRPPYQIWIMYFLESPYHTPSVGDDNNYFNWTSTYRHDSTIVAPYEKFVPYNEKVRFKPQTKNYAAGKTKMVAWFVSNCGAQNTRLEYARELAKYVQVDIYGNCGELKCPRHQASTCFDKLNKDYKFYLAFENSNCFDYITEKFYVNGLQHDVIPIGMGGRPEDYRRQAPPDSHLHVDDFDGPEDLANYLKLLDKNDDLYNHYFRWKGTGEFVNTFWWCRACSMLHAPSAAPQVVRDAEKWWRGPGVCIGKDSWRKHGYRPVKPYGRQ